MIQHLGPGILLLYVQILPIQDHELNYIFNLQVLGNTPMHCPRYMNLLEDTMNSKWYDDTLESFKV